MDHTFDMYPLHENTGAPSREQARYFQNLNVQFLFFNRKWPYVLVLIPIIFAIGWPYIQVLGRFITEQLNESFQQTILPLSAPSAPLGSIPWNIFGLPLLLVYVIAVWGIYGSYYEWRHTFVTLTDEELAVYRPYVLLLNIRRQEILAVDADDITGFSTHASVLQKIIFRNSRTVSITVKDSEGDNPSPVNLLKYVNEPLLLQQALRSVRQLRPKR